MPNATPTMKMIIKPHRIPKIRKISGVEMPTDEYHIIPFEVCNCAKYIINYKGIVLKLNHVELDNKAIMQNLNSSFFNHAPYRNTLKAHKNMKWDILTVTEKLEIQHFHT